MAETRDATEVAQIRSLFDRGCERVGLSLVAQVPFFGPFAVLRAGSAALQGPFTAPADGRNAARTNLEKPQLPATVGGSR
ncbi:MAG: hypothetical protein ABSH01_05640 [Terriglobia bacterium]